jgi:hypothetical protein
MKKKKKKVEGGKRHQRYLFSRSPAHAGSSLSDSQINFVQE